ncbi:MAG TPA: 2-dehydropantoate 2-reductase [Hyphomicrobiaceae bacterium]|nr:2-dehydropantoate 2-reductase [Hyphomicrobiaceae bacterium]
MAAGLQSRITVAGAGSIGCYVGGCLALAQRNVTLLLRPALADAIGRRGLRISDLEGADRALPAGSLKLTTEPAPALENAEIILVTVKSGATAEIADLIAQHAKARPVVVSLQNGVGNVDVLRGRLGVGCVVVPGVVNFHVAQFSDADPPRFHRATGGSILIGSEVAGLSDALSVTGVRVRARENMPAVLWGKLLLNLNNALNALSGLPLVSQLGNRGWRRVLAAQVDEAFAVLAAAGIRPARVEQVPPRLMPTVLRLPDALFRIVARRMMSIDPEARSSMWEDLHRRRTTEIDYLQGAIVGLGDKTGTATPIARRIVTLIKAAEAEGRGSPGLSPDQVMGGAQTQFG